MKTKRLLLPLLLILALTFSACGETIPAPQDTPVPATATKPPATQPRVEEAGPVTTGPVETEPVDTGLPATPTQPAAPTSAPTSTLEPTPAPTETEAAAAGNTPAPSDTPAGSVTPPSGLGPVPVLGQWGGGSGSDLILSFVISMENGQVMLSDLGVLWFGRNECGLNQMIESATPITGPEFTRFFNGSYDGDDIHYTLSGEIISETVIQGVLDLSVEGCGARDYIWRAIPKP